MAAHEKLGDVALGEGPLDEFLSALQQAGTVDTEGVFTLDREKAREKMQRFQLAQPARYILELVQAAVLRGATLIRFEISATQVRMMCAATPFVVKDFEDLYESLFARGHGASRQALRHLALGLCTALAMEPKQIRVSGGGESGAALVMRPGSRDKFGKGGDRGHGLLVELSRRPWVLSRGLLGSTPMEQVEHELLLDCCGLSMVPIEINGMPIASGYQLPGALYWRHFRQGSTRGVVAVAKGALPHSTPTLLHLMRNCISFEKDTPPGLLPGFLALIESPSFHLDISHQRIVRNEAFAQALILVVEQQLQLLVADCEQICRGTWPHPPELMRGLLLGLLEQLGSLDPLARWAGLPGSYPRVAPPQFPERVPGAQWLLDAPVLLTIDKRLVSLRQVLDDRQRHGSVAMVTSTSAGLSLQRPLVLWAQHPRERQIYGAVFNTQSDPAGSSLQHHPTRIANLERWRKRRQEPKLLSPPNLLRVTVTPALFVGEVGVELVTDSRPTVSPPEQLSLTLLHLDGVLAVYQLPCSVRGLHAILGGEFSPTDLWDGVLPDQRLETAVAQLLETLPILAAAIILEWRETLSRQDAGAGLRHAVRGLLLLAGSEQAQSELHKPLRLRPDAQIAALLRSQFSEVIATEQVATAPLFERLSGPPLSLRELERELERRGAIAVVARRSPGDAELVDQRDRWAQCLADESMSEDLLARAIPAWGAPASRLPSFVLWFDGPLAQLAQVLQVLWGKPALEDVRDGLNQAIELRRMLHARHLPRPAGSGSQQGYFLSVPIPELAGELGLLRDEQLHSADSLVRVWVQAEGQAPTLQLCVLPAGGWLVANVARDALLIRDGENRGQLDQTALRRALLRALLALCAAQGEWQLVPAAVWQRFARAIIAAPFPHPAFRANYERLRWLAVREGHPVHEAEHQHRRILSLSMQHSPAAVHSALVHLLSKSADQPVTAPAIARWLLRQADGAALPSREASEAQITKMAGEVPGLLDYLGLFFPTAGSLAQRVLQPVAVLQSLPLCQAVDGRWLSLGEVLAEVQQYGDVQYLPAGTEPPERGPPRLLLRDTGDALSTLHSLLGEFRLRAYDPNAVSELADLSELASPGEIDALPREEPPAEDRSEIDAATRDAVQMDVATLLADLPSPPAGSEFDESMALHAGAQTQPVAAAPRLPLPAIEPDRAAASFIPAAASPAPRPTATPAARAVPVDAASSPRKGELAIAWSVDLAVADSPPPTAGTQAQAEDEPAERREAASTSDTIAALNRDASTWLRITHAAASLIESLRPGQAQRAEHEARILAALFSELRLIAGDGSPLLGQINLSRIRLASVASRQAVLCTPHQTLINRRHPAVRRVLRAGTSDPAAIWFLCAAVYTALNIFLVEVTDQDEAQFLALLCRRAESVLQGRTPGAGSPPSA